MTVEPALFRASAPAAALSKERVLVGVGLALTGVVVVLLRLGGDPLGFHIDVPCSRL